MMDVSVSFFYKFSTSITALLSTGNRNVEKKRTKLLRLSRQPSPVQIMTDQEQLQNAQYCNHMDSVITNDARRTRKIKSMIAMATAAFTSTLDLNLQEPKEMLHLEHCCAWC
jgi:hypothetical protein